MNPEKPSKVEETIVKKDVARDKMPSTWMCTIPKKEKIANSGFVYPWGHRNLSKMALFLAECNFSIEDYQYFTNSENFPAYRKEGEFFEDYKDRQKFINALEKYRIFVKNFLYAETIQAAIKKYKEQKEQETKQELIDNIQEQEKSI